MFYTPPGTPQKKEKSEHMNGLLYSPFSVAIDALFKYFRRPNYLLS